jgi:parallel beta-helix repeat protein
VSGTCKENLVIHEEVARITLDGQGKATIEGADAGKRIIEVRGRGITIKGFTVTGGAHGIQVTVGGQAVIDGNTVQGAAGHGILVNKTSYAVIVNNTVQNNARFGIVITASSFGFVGLLTPGDKTASPNIIENNGRAGIAVAYSSAARIVGNTIRNNKRGGIHVDRVSQADISNNTIDGNSRNGILVRQNSNVRLGRRGSRITQLPNSTTSNNSGVGISCVSNSSVEGRLGSLNGDKGAKDVDPSCVVSLKP